MKWMLGWVLVGWMMITFNSSGATRGGEAGRWESFNEALQLGQPRTALEKLPALLAEALKQKRWGEAARAIAFQAQLEAQTEPNPLVVRIQKLEQSLAAQPDPIQLPLRVLLVKWYSTYYHQNQYRLLDRTRIASGGAADVDSAASMESWGLPRLFREMDRQFQGVLAREKELIAIPVEQLSGLLVGTGESDRLRPTLFDFVAHAALEFYGAGEWVGADTKSEVVFLADQPVYGVIPLFGTPEEFVAGKVERRAEESPQERALFVFRRLVQLHLKDADPAALVDVELARLDWAREVAKGSRNRELELAAFKRLTERWAASPAVSLVWHGIAANLHEGQDWVEARRVAETGAKLHPKSEGAKLCRNLMAQIDEKQLEMQTESVWVPGQNPGYSELTVQYRNITELNLRLVKSEWEDRIRGRVGQDEAFRKSLLTAPVVKAWKHPLPLTADFQMRTEQLTVPNDIPPGHYVLLASSSERFDASKDQIHLAEVLVSSIGVVVRSREGMGEALVVDATSGAPLSGVAIELWRGNNQGRVLKGGEGRTDEQGWYRWNRTANEQMSWVRAKLGDNEAVASLWVGRPMNPRNQMRSTVFLFTDRAIYRPGQTIQYKGIVVETDPAKQSYRIVAEREVVLVLYDVNGQEVSRMKHRTGVNGSFAGASVAPVGRLLGWMRLTAVEGAEGTASFQVEEYKRPKFQVKLESPREAVALGGKVRVEGVAMGYTGAPVDGAEVKWRVNRHARVSPWWEWRMAPQHGAEAEEMGSGTTRTDAAGKFWLEFTAKPDEDLSAEAEPVFSFETQADVTDAAGETRSDSHTVHAGYTAFALTGSVEEWQSADKPVVVKLSARSHNDAPVSAQGVVRVYRVKQPERVNRGSIEMGQLWGRRSLQGKILGSNSDTDSDPRRWALGEQVLSREFVTGTNGMMEISVPLGSGLYRAVSESVDSSGKKVRSEVQWTVLEPESEVFSVKIPHHVVAPKWECEVGETWVGVWGTGYSQGRCFVEVEREGKALQRFWTDGKRTQQKVEQVIEESMRGGLVVRFTQVSENRIYQVERTVTVPELSRNLRMRWERFVSKLQPAQSVDWSLVVEPPAAQRGGAIPKVLPAEVVAVLYDGSLEAFREHRWPKEFELGHWQRGYGRSVYGQLGNQLIPVTFMLGEWPQTPMEPVGVSYRDFDPLLESQEFGRRPAFQTLLPRSRFMAAPAPVGAGAMEGMAMGVAADRMVSKAAPAAAAEDAANAGVGGGPGAGGGSATGAKGGKQPANVMPRRQLQETAFFFPQLLSDSNGVVRMKFTVPDSLTEWKFMGFAHDAEVRSGLLQDTAVSSKDLMVQPNPPRFMREGDELEFTAKISNRSEKRQSGKARMVWKHAVSGDDASAALVGVGMESEQAFEVPAMESKVVTWKLKIPDGMGPVIYQVTAATETFSDGEEGMIPVLSRRVFVTESMPLTMRGAGTHRFEFGALKEALGSGRVEPQGLKVQVVSNPTWYALMALPYLMDYPHECSEQTFSRFYANALAKHVVGSQPKLKELFESWKQGETLKSPLEKNEDLKSVLLEETPWVREAQDEEQGRRNLALFLDGTRVEYELGVALGKLREMQLGDGNWPWFPGGLANEYITLYVTAGFGRLKHMGVDVSMELAVKALPALDAWMANRYRTAQKHKPAEQHIDSTVALYLYARSFFQKDFPVNEESRGAWDYWVEQARTYGLKVGSVQSEAHLALALHRMGDAVNAGKLVKSLVERRIEDREMGAYWVRTGLWGGWSEAPIETQALMIELMEEVARDEGMVEAGKRWLLNQKRGQHWATTKSTADAVYALMLRGGDWMVEGGEVKGTLGNVRVEPQAGGKTIRGVGRTGAEAGTGFYEVRVAGNKVRPEMANIVLEKGDARPSWVSVHWQYFAPMDWVKPMTNNPLRVEKQLFVKKNTAQGPALEEVKGPVKVGDELVTRIEVIADRDLEFIHLKDQRGSGVEATEVLSGYRWTGGLGYYRSTRDTASHFFLDSVPRGRHVLEYSVRVQLRGRYVVGLAELQSMYAPEFNSHSAAQTLVVE